MFISKKVSELKEPLDVDLQMIASELDISVQDMRYLSRDLMPDYSYIVAFDKLFFEIEERGGELTFDDNTMLYECTGESIIIHNILGDRYILFDNSITQKIENELKRYRDRYF